MVCDTQNNHRSCVPWSQQSHYNDTRYQQLQCIDGKRLSTTCTKKDDAITEIKKHIPISIDMFTTKKLVIFDGDGTLRYPATTKHTQEPHRIYAQYSPEEANKQLVLIP